MIICVCNNVSEKTINQVLDEKEISSVEELKKEIKVCSGCECCYFELSDMISAKDTIGKYPVIPIQIQSVFDT